VVACLFLSGTASLVLEVVWSRLLRLVFGSTTLAVSTILVAYMLGLGLGGLLGGRIAARLRNGVRAYGWIEVGVGLYAVAVPFILDLFPLLDRTLLAGQGFWVAALGRFVVVLLVLLLPTVLMGATLPILVAALARGSAAVASRVGLLYGVNTLGAVAGVLVSTFFLFGAIGVRGTNLVGAALDVAVGAVAVLVLAPRFVVARPAEPSPADAIPAPGRRRWSPAVLAYGAVGFSALVYEVSWTRVLAMVLGSSVYAFATMLAAFLAGIALGSLLARRWGDRFVRPIAAYAVGVGALGLLALGTLMLLGLLPDLFISTVAGLGASRTGLVATGVVVSMLAMLGPTLVLGALFPLLARAAVGKGNDPARSVGEIYFVNTLGSAAGAFSAGFLLIPAFGLRMTMALAIALDLAVAAGLLLWQREWTGTRRTVAAAVAGLAAALVLIFPPAWDAAALTRGTFLILTADVDVGIEPIPITGIRDREILYYRDGLNATVSVHRSWGDTFLRINGKGEAGTGSTAMPTQVLAGQIPMLFGPRPERVLVVGLASGVTAGSAALHKPARLDVVELEPAVVDASHLFDDYNNRPLAQPFTRLITDDGRSHLARTRERYDVIISQPSNPWITGSASLFTREYFQAARRALAPGGRFLLWVQLYGIEPDTLRAILAALRAEFPRLYGFADRWSGNDLFLLAMDRPLARADLPAWEQLAEPARNDLRRINTFSTADLWSLLRFLPGDIEAIAGKDAPVNTDDNMLVELRTPWALHDAQALEANWKRLTRFSGGAAAIAEHGGAPLDGETLGALALSFVAVRGDAEAGRDLLRNSEARGGGPAALVAQAQLLLRGSAPDPGGALRLLDEAVARYPDAFLPRLYRAQLRYSMEKYAEALDDSNKALAAMPGDLRARFVRLEALSALNRPADARVEAEALLASPYLQLDRQLWAFAAHAAAGLGRFDQAIPELWRYLQWVPYSAVEWPVLGRMYEAAGKPDEARVALENAGRAARNRVLTLHRQALQTERLGSKQEAIALLREALAADPTYEPARKDLRRLGVSAEQSK
jgi:spermidine synthase